MSNDESRIELRGDLWMTVEGRDLGGSGRVALLAKIAECGSITQAAKSAKVSYKAAWDAIDAMNTLAGEPLVQTLTGGKGGGGTQLTRRGEQLVRNFKLIDQEHQRFVSALSRESERIADDLVLIRRMGMKTSARNQFFGPIVRIQHGAVNDMIELAISPSQRLIATITCESTTHLGLEEGMEVFALVKASSILLARDNGDGQFSAQNRLAGRVSRLTPGKVNDEVAIELDGGGVIAAIVSCEYTRDLALDKGSPVLALFNASSVILGVTA